MWRRECTGKKRYETHEEASAARPHAPRGIGLEAYSCAICGGFHLGSPVRRYKRAEFRERHIREVGQRKRASDGARANRRRRARRARLARVSARGER